MKKVIYYILLSIIPISGFSITPVQQLTKLLGNLRTMQASFVQFSNNKLSQSSKGIMFLQRPGKFRWEVRAPSKQLIVVDGKDVWVYYADLQQAVKRKIDYRQAGNPAMLLSGSTKRLQKLFTITSLGTGIFNLKPNTKGMFQKVLLYFDQAKLTKIEMLDNLGQHTVFKFSNIRINSPLNKVLFSFNPPKGTDVVQE